MAQRDDLRSVGDQSLFITGFFADSLNRSLVDVDFYIHLGELAYRSLARNGDRSEVDAILTRLATERYGLRSMIHEVVGSSLFRNK